MLTWPARPICTWSKGAALLHPEETVFEAMLEGWRTQQTSRYLNAMTVRQREAQVRRFQRWANEYPWAWKAADVEEWTTAAISERHLAHSTVSDYTTLRLFMEFICDARYGWAEGVRGPVRHPPGANLSRVEHGGALGEDEGRPGNRPLSREELQLLFDYADERVARSERLGPQRVAGGVPGRHLVQGRLWVGAPPQGGVDAGALRSGPQPQGPGVRRPGGDHRAVGESVPGRRRRGVGGCSRSGRGRWRWSSSIWPKCCRSMGRPMAVCGHRAGRPGGRLRTSIATFARLRTEVGLPAELGPHCLRHSYVTHLLEDGWDPLFVQQQVGHTWASTTAVYTGVSSDYKNQVLRQKLDAMLATEG